MSRPNATPSRLIRWAPIGLALLTAPSVAPAHAQQPSSACRLLQVAEIESAIGGKASKEAKGERVSVPGMDLDECAVEITVPGHKGIDVVAVRIVKDLPMDGGEAIRMRNGGTAREGGRKDPGARLEQKTVGSAICILYEHPGVVGHTVCSTPRGKGYVEVDARASEHELASIDTVRALLQKAMSRL